MLFFIYHWLTDLPTASVLKCGYCSLVWQLWPGVAELTVQAQHADVGNSTGCHGCLHSRPRMASPNPCELVDQGGILHTPEACFCLHIPGSARHLEPRYPQIHVWNHEPYKFMYEMIIWIHSLYEFKSDFQYEMMKWILSLYEFKHEMRTWIHIYEFICIGKEFV